MSLTIPPPNHGFERKESCDKALKTPEAKNKTQPELKSNAEIGIQAFKKYDQARAEVQMKFDKLSPQEKADAIMEKQILTKQMKGDEPLTEEQLKWIASQTKITKAAKNKDVAKDVF